MKSLLTFLIISTACFQIAFARIGETVAECDKRYGACREASLDGSFKEYSVNRLLVTCIFVDAKCVIVTYAIRWSSPVIQAPIGKDRRFSEEQATRLLNLNGNGAAWVQKSKLTFTNGNDGIYETADGKLQALVNFTGVKIETVESYRSRLAGMSDEVIDQALVGIGAKGGGPALQTAKFPLSKEEQENLDSDVRMKALQENVQKMEIERKAHFEAIQANLEKLKTENKAAFEALPKN